MRRSYWTSTSPTRRPTAQRPFQKQAAATKVRYQPAQGTVHQQRQSKMMVQSQRPMRPGTPSPTHPNNSSNSSSNNNNNRGNSSLPQPARCCLCCKQQSCTMASCLVLWSAISLSGSLSSKSAFRATKCLSNPKRRQLWFSCLHRCWAASSTHALQASERRDRGTTSSLSTGNNNSSRRSSTEATTRATPATTTKATTTTTTTTTTGTTSGRATATSLPR
mmetsp:Transcript_20021/g.43542  ORF Transcript_20021/g.43542 Transcript_20021/m.43542 type:complete len:220 (-) Transcript_20021:2227-2886(-)